jgi:aminodeoxyfutalosine synthase
MSTLAAGLLHVRDSALHPIIDRVLEGKRITFDEGMTLYRTRDLPALLRLADIVRERRVGDKAYFVHSLRLSQTNVCYVGCTFCGFAKHFDDAGVWDYDLDQVWDYVDRHYHPELTEIHIASGHHPKRSWDYYLDLVRGLTERYPGVQVKAWTAAEIHIASGHHPKRSWDYYLDLVRGLTERYPGVQVKAWTAAEIHHFTKITRPRLTYREVLQQLKDAGLVAMPGGGAEIFAEGVRRRIARAKVTAEGWLEVHKTAHELGIPTNATMLYGHVETLEDRLDHMHRLRDLQDVSGGFLSFIPLAYQPENNALAAELEAEGRRARTTGVDDLRNLAVARIYLDNFPHIKGYWIMITPEQTQVALAAGVSDVDGTIKDERIAHASGAETEMGMSEEALVKLIRDAGRVPVRRDALYRELKVFA